MSVSLSSVYEQTESLRQIQQKFEEVIKSQAGFQSGIGEIVDQARNLTMSESYRLVVVLSKYLNNNSSVIKKYTALYLLKNLVLTALHHYYIFVSVRALMWIFNTAKFQARKNQYERARMYIKQLSLKGNGDEVIQQRQCYRLLKLVDQFLPWTSQNIPIHINAEFQFPSTFARSYEQLNPKRQINSYQYFSTQDYKKFQQNFNKSKSQNKEIIKQLSQFIGLEVKSLIDQQKYKSELLRQIVRTGDSYCIRTIVSEICGLIEDNSKIFYCLKLLEFLVNLGEIQFIQLVKLYAVPTLLGYLLPINFIEGKRLDSVPFTCSLSEQKCIIDFICIWARITEKVGLSTKFYTETIKAIQASKGNVLNVQQNHLKEFYIKVLDMEKLNNTKKPYIQNMGIEQQLIRNLNLKQKQAVNRAPVQLRTSAINQLSQFKDSQISIGAKSDQSASYAAIFRSPFQVNPNSNKNVVTPGKPIQQLENSQQIMTFKQVLISNNQLILSESPLKQPLRMSKGKDESSFMAFKESNMSKFSEYQVKRSKEGEFKPQNSGAGLLKQQFHGNSNIQKTIESKSQSVVYFDRSDEFHSENSVQQNKKSLNQSKSLKLSISIAKSFKSQQLSDQNASTYKFDSSNIGSSASNSEIQNFGKEDLNFPESVPKPTFGFKTKDQENKRSKQYYMTGSQKILDNSSSIKKQHSLLNQNGIGKKRNLMDSQSSQIKDLSGGKHINQSIRFSQGSEIMDKQQGVDFKKSGNFSPYAEYYPSTKLQQEHNNGNGMQIRKSPPNQRLTSQSPHALKKSVSDKMIFSNQNLLKMQQMSLENRSKPPISQSKNSKQMSEVKKKHIILDEFTNDKLLELEKQLGRALQQKSRKQQQLKKKQVQYKILKSKSIPYMGRKVQTLKKQDEIINILLNQKNKQDYATKIDYIKPVKYQNKLSDYFLENEAKGKYIPASQPYDRIFIKQILGSRCLLLSNEQFELGYNYSQIQNQVSFYLTFLKIFDAINVQVHENSLILEKPVSLNLENQPAGYQLKIKRKVKAAKMAKKQPTFNEAITHNSLNSYRFPQISIKVTNQSGEHLIFRTIIPCSILNLAVPIEIKNDVIEELVGKRILRSDPLPLSQQFVNNHKQKIEKYFPQNMALVGGWTLLGYRFPTNIFQKMENQYFKFKIVKGKTVEFELFNDPKSYLAQALTCIFYAKSK